MTSAESNNQAATVAEFRERQRDVVKDAAAAGIPKFCVRRELRGHLAALAEGADDEGKLWCVHVLGPDTIIPQPSRAVAEARAELWNGDIEEMMNRKGPSAFDPVIRCVAEPYPYSAKGHAEGLAEHGGEPEDIC